MVSEYEREEKDRARGCARERKTKRQSKTERKTQREKRRVQIEVVEVFLSIF